jgi:hypothetical protein
VQALMFGWLANPHASFKNIGRLTAWAMPGQAARGRLIPIPMAPTRVRPCTSSSTPTHVRERGVQTVYGTQATAYGTHLLSSAARLPRPRAQACLRSPLGYARAALGQGLAPASRSHRPFHEDRLPFQERCGAVGLRHARAKRHDSCT